MKFYVYLILFGLFCSYSSPAQDSLLYADPNPFEDSTNFVIDGMGNDTATIIIFDRTGDTVAIPVRDEPISGYTIIPFQGDTLVPAVYIAFLELTDRQDIINLTKGYLRKLSFCVNNYFVKMV